MTTLTLERRSQVDRTTTLGADRATVSLTPRIDEDYWTYRVRLTETQAVVGFPKFSTIGIGFAVEDDWNTNLPYKCDTEQIVVHICHNAGDPAITPLMIAEAVDLIRRAAYEDRPDDAVPDGWETTVHPYEPAHVERRVNEKLAAIEAGEDW